MKIGQYLAKIWTAKDMDKSIVCGFFGPPCISDLLSYKGCQLVERPAGFGGKRKKKERNFCCKIEYLRLHSYVWAEV